MPGAGGVERVALEEAWRSADAARFVRNVYPMYVHDLSAFDTAFYTLDDLGRWQPDLVEDWLAPRTPAANVRDGADAADALQPLQRAHVITAGGRRVGFACVGLAPFRYMREDCDRIMAEFFVVHGQRGRGVAEPAALELFRRYPGRWQVSAIHDNARAIAFWRRVLHRLAAPDTVESQDFGDLRWMFRTPPG